MSEKKDYYQILGLSKDASADQIMDAYRMLALKYHPDRNKTLEAEEKMKQINEAYNTLSDNKKRAVYLQTQFGAKGQYSWQHMPEDKMGWNVTEDEFLFKNFLNLDDEELAEKLGKSTSKVRHRRNILSLTRPIFVKNPNEPKVQRIVFELRKKQKMFCEVNVSGGNGDIYFAAFGYKGTASSFTPANPELLSNQKTFIFQVAKAGNYCFYFSNSFSLLTSKNVKFSYLFENGRKITLTFNI
jgi:hypothetical protein